MSDVIEVADAEQITGHTHSILIQTPDCSTFVKGTCQEESKWWYNVLVQLVKCKVRLHKRNAFLKGQNQKCKLLFDFSNDFWLISVSVAAIYTRQASVAGNCVGIEWHNRMFTGAAIFSIQLEFSNNNKFIHERASGGLIVKFPRTKMQARRARKVCPWHLTEMPNATQLWMEVTRTHYFVSHHFHTVRLALRNSERELGVGSSTVVVVAAATTTPQFEEIARTNYSQMLRSLRRVSTRDNTKRLDNCL